ncbi:MAG: universal stress protein [Rhodocyclaceae bacterium]|nr:universal stress protein [Rhodocyclaceae bacterium]
MTNLKRILATTDFSALGSGAIARAALLAAREDGELLIVHAIPRLSVLRGVFGADDELPIRMRTIAEASLAALVESAAQAGVRRVRGEIVEGSAHRAVADTADSFHPDLLVIGAHGKGLVRQFFLGGTASRILAHAACPVLVVRRAPEGDYRQALIAVDLMSMSRAETVLRVGLVTAARARIAVINAYQSPFEAKLRYKGFPEEDIARYAEPEAQAAQRNMQTLLADPDLAGLALESRIVHGHPNPVLPDAASALSADLIVAGRHAGSRLEEAAMGSVSKFLVYYAPCDVLVV